MIQIEEILKSIPEKHGFHKNTTSLKWKKDFLNFFIDKNLDKCLEIGTCDGVTTKILSKIFKETWSIEFNLKRLNRAKEFCKNENNINFIHGDAYSDNYGHPQHPGVKKAIDDSISQGLKLEKFIGEEPGFTVTRSDNTSFTLSSKEGIILSYEI